MSEVTCEALTPVWLGQLGRGGGVCAEDARVRHCDGMREEQRSQMGVFLMREDSSPFQSELQHGSSGSLGAPSGS